MLHAIMGFAQPVMGFFDSLVGASDFASLTTNIKDTVESCVPIGASVLGLSWSVKFIPKTIKSIGK